MIEPGGAQKVELLRSATLAANPILITATSTAEQSGRPVRDRPTAQLPSVWRRTSPGKLRVAHFDGHGLPDVLIDLGRPLIIYGDRGDGSLVEGHFENVGGHHNAVGDVDGDGRPDAPVVPRGTTPFVVQPSKCFALTGAWGSTHTRPMPRRITDEDAAYGMVLSVRAQPRGAYGSA